METQRFEAIVIGAGMAGATAAAHLSATRPRLALLEAEESAGRHATGRSAALWILNYGPPDARALSGASRAFLESPPPGFTEAPLTRRRAGAHRPAATEGDDSVRSPARAGAPDGCTRSLHDAHAVRARGRRERADCLTPYVA